MYNDRNLPPNRCVVDLIEGSLKEFSANQAGPRTQSKLLVCQSFFHKFISTSNACFDSHRVLLTMDFEIIATFGTIKCVRTENYRVFVGGTIAKLLIQGLIGLKFHPPQCINCGMW